MSSWLQTETLVGVTRCIRDGERDRERVCGHTGNKQRGEKVLGLVMVTAGSKGCLKCMVSVRGGEKGPGLLSEG
jgi:hypothetical protein